MVKRIVSSVLSTLILTLAAVSPLVMSGSAWSNGGYSADPSNPDYGTHDWIAEHALDWLPLVEKQYVLDNPAAFLYGTELPDNGGAPDGIGDTAKHHVYYNSAEVITDDAAAVRTSTEYSNTLNFLRAKDYAKAAKNAGIMSHYIADMAVFGHVMGSVTDWGAEVHHSDYETYVNDRTSSYSADFNSYLSFDGSLTTISAYDAAKNLAYDTTFDVDGDLTCVWMDQNYDWGNSTFKNRAGESLNLAVNYLADVLHTLYLDAVWTVDDDGPADFSEIQEAINAASSGDIIYVHNGTYHEKVVVNEEVSLIGENRDATIIDGDAAGTVVELSADNISIISFTIRNAGETWGPPLGHGYPDSCVRGSDVMHVHIENNIFSGAAVCVWFAYSSFVNVSNNIVLGATYAGVVGYASSNITTRNNYVYDCGLMGIHLDDGSNHCRIAGNIVMNNLEGMEFEGEAAGNLIEDNLLIGNNASIVLNGCGGLNVFRGNNMTSEQYNLIIFGSDLNSFMQDIDDSNTANHKTVYYLTSLRDVIIDPSHYPNMGYLAVVNCTNITVRDFNITRNGDGVLWAYSANCTLTNVTLSGNRGPLLWGGITFFESNNNTVVGNKIDNNSYAVCLYHSDGNVFHHNSLIYNNRQVVPDFLSPFSDKSSGYYSLNIWDDGYPSGGNYWSDYTDIDVYSGLYQNETGSDGVGDTPYIIDTNNQDRYPLMNPWVLIDTDPPALLITSPSPQSEIKSSTVTVTWTGSDETSGISHYEIRLDDGSWTSVGTNTTYTFSGLGDGSHTVNIKATDNARNTKQDTVNFIVNTSPFLGPGYTEETAIAAAIVILAFGIALYFLKIKKH